MTLEKPFPSIATVELTLKKRCDDLGAKYVNSFSLSEKWYAKLKQTWVKSFEGRVIEKWAPQVKQGKLSLDQVRERLDGSSIEDQTAVITCGLSKTLKKFPVKSLSL